MATPLPKTAGPQISPVIGLRVPPVWLKHMPLAESGHARSRWIASILTGLVLGTAAAAAAISLGVVTRNRPALSATASAPVLEAPRSADFGLESPSPDARHLADWIADARNNAGTDFVIVDKPCARIYVFDAKARLRGASPVLVGFARGDDSVPDIGSRPIPEVRPAERTTPAGRFIAERGRNSKGEDVVWVDYDDSVSMHRVRAIPGEQRLQRLATPTIDDNRITYGCINVPAAFYETYIRPIFAAHRAIVYVLPDIKPMQQVFGAAFGRFLRKLELASGGGMSSSRQQCQAPLSAGWTVRPAELPTPSQRRTKWINPSPEALSSHQARLRAIRSSIAKGRTSAKSRT